MKLAFKKMGSGRPMIILHGLFGSSDNWQTLGRKFADNFEVFLVDQRNHGHSPHSAVFSYDVMAQDLKSFCIDQGIVESILIGHSMGGKTAMRFSQLFPERVAKLIVVDMGVKGYEPHHQDILAAFGALDLPKLESRSQAEEEMKARIPDFGVRQFILKNLYRKTKTEFAWRVNYKVLEAKMDEILKPLPQKPVSVSTLFIAGAKSNYIQPEDLTEIEKIFINAQFVELPTGHWVHAEDPEGFFKKVKNFVTE